MRRLLSALLILFLLTGAAAAEDLRLISVNVGKADCHLLLAGEQIYMFDTGTADSWGCVSAVLQALNITRLDAVIVTHTDSDHAGGADALAASSVEVAAWYASPFYNCKEKKHPVLKAARLDGKNAAFLHAGDVLPLGEGTLKVLGPLRPDGTIENNNSLVLLAETPEGRILMTGDMQLAEEEDLLAAGVLGPVTVLKVPDHAENHAVSQRLLTVTMPQIALIPTNTREEPDTPAPRIMNGLRQVGAQIVITQDAPAYVEMIVSGGRAEASLYAITPPESTAAVRIAEKDPNTDTVTICNDGAETVDIGGWFIHSERGNETFVFPAGTMLAPGQRVTVASLTAARQGDFTWQEEKIWHKTKDDTAILFDCWGREADRME